MRPRSARLSETLSIVVSIFGLVGIGYAAARTRLLPASVGDGLTDFVFTVPIPLLLFRTLAAADLGGLSPWRIWAAYFVPFVAVWALSHLMVRRVFGRDARAGVVAGGSAAFSNTILVGIPLVQAAFGDSGMLYLIVIVSIHLAILMLVSVVLNEWAAKADGAGTDETSRAEALRRVAVALATQPILIAIAAGLVWRAAELPVPGWSAGIIDPLARAAGPLALFATGMAMAGHGIARQIGPAAAIAALKLLVMPGLVFAAAHIAGLPSLGVAAVTLVAACPTGVNAFLIAGRLGTGQALASNTLLIATAGGVASVTLWLAVLKASVP